jgi:hypothetical protein
VPRAHLLLSLVSEGLVDHSQQTMVLPCAKSKRHGDCGQGDEQARPQLIQMINDADAVLVTDLADGDSHVARSCVREDGRFPGAPSQLLGGARLSRLAGRDCDGGGLLDGSEGRLLVRGLAGLAAQRVLEAAHAATQ